MARRNSFADDLVEIATRLPWWVSLVIAVVAWFGLGAYAASEPPATPGDPLGSVSGAIPRAFALVGKFLIAGTFVIGAFFSLARSLRNRQLFNRVSRNALDASARYHGDDVDPLIKMSWQDFEQLVGEVLRRRGYSVADTPAGADGGVDLVARRDGETLLVQCKQWRTRDVGVAVVRELRGVVAARRAAGGMVVTVGRFTQEASQFAREAGIELVDGESLRRLARECASASSPAAMALAQPAPEQAFGCPVCGSGMVRRVAKRGANAGQAFFGCSRYPRCKGTRAT